MQHKKYLFDNKKDAENNDLYTECKSAEQKHIFSHITVGLSVKKLSELQKKGSRGPLFISMDNVLQAIL